MYWCAGVCDWICAHVRMFLVKFCKVISVRLSIFAHYLIVINIIFLFILEKVVDRDVSFYL